MPKKDRELRLCIDYRWLNDVTVKDRYPIPLISELQNRVSGVKWFTKVNIKEAYYLVPMKKGDEWKMAFRTHYG